MEATKLISALAKVVEAKKATDKAYKALSKAFFNGTDEELHNAVKSCKNRYHSTQRHLITHLWQLLTNKTKSI